MADLTSQVVLSATWENMTSTVPLSNGETYLVDCVSIDDGTTIYSAKTDNETAPSSAIAGHGWQPIRRWGVGLNQRQVRQNGGEVVWARTDQGAATLAFTKV